MYKKINKELRSVDREKNILHFWKDHRIFEKSVSMREGGKVFSFYDGPPTANGKPHIGHILTRVIKDIIPRYKTMKGYHVIRKAGWDTHGLPVELEVEKELGIDGKNQIEAYGVEPFIEKCKESVWRYRQEWEKMSDRVGFWADMEHPYVTYDNDYIESVWWSLKQIWDQGLLYKGHKIIPYCPRCGTSLSSHEVAQGYKDVTEQSAIVKFKVKDAQNAYILAWTTTPWTLPSNVALTVHPTKTYIKVSHQGNTYILAKELVEEHFSKDEFEILEEKQGADYVGLAYEPLFDFIKPDAYDQKGFIVVADEYVQMDEGTGIVHCAPAFGEDDARVGKEYDLPFIQLVDEEGMFKKQADRYEGMFVKDADPKIIRDLDDRSLLFDASDFTHSYPFCWRCDTSLIYYARNTWFIEMTKIKSRLMESNKQIHWYPPGIGTNRFGNFLENLVDWGLSRERYWGTPLPIWECTCGFRECIGSIAELRQKGIEVPDDLDLHKPNIDHVKVACSECGGRMTRVSEVIDCWYDSGSMPFAQWHYPFENKEVFEKNFPADFISEALDQTRGWFYTLHAISNLLFDQQAYKNCIVLGLVQDKDGQKMSKHKGNVVDPWVVLDNQGADAVRWYFYTASAPWLPSRFYEQAVGEAQRQFLGTLWNTYAFYVMYASIDEFNPKEHTLEKDTLSTMDRWILSRLHSTIRQTDQWLDEYKITEAARGLQAFTDELSNWYVRRCRERFWAEGMAQDKVNAYMTLHTVLSTLSRLCAPFIPFMSDEIWQNLVVSLDEDAPLSVHLSDFPKTDESLISDELEKQMEAVLQIVTLGRACRNQAGMKNRQPLSTLYVKTNQMPSDLYIPIIQNELNVKNVEQAEDDRAFVSYQFKPQLKTVGPKYGKLLPKITAYLNENDPDDLMRRYKDEGKIHFAVNGQSVTLSESDLIIETVRREGFYSEDGESNELTVILDVNLTNELIDEGFLREILSKVQTMRKEADFEITDHILLYFEANERIQKLMERYRETIQRETLTDKINQGLCAQAYCKTWSINGEKVQFCVKKAQDG